MLNRRGLIILVSMHLIFILATIAAAKHPTKQKESPDTAQIERGRYLVKIAGCNDCHTPGYTQKIGKIPEKEWLTGDRLGWRGPWGTTYPSNLRIFMSHITERQWVKVAHTARFRPPMPWFALHAMTEEDLRAIYHFVRYLGPSGRFHH